jgi:hypothetical protein
MDMSTVLGMLNSFQTQKPSPDTAEKSGSGGLNGLGGLGGMLGGLGGGSLGGGLGGITGLLEQMDKSGSMKNLSGIFNLLPEMMKVKNQPTEKSQNQSGGTMRNHEYEAYNTSNGGESVARRGRVNISQPTPSAAAQQTTPIQPAQQPQQPQQQSAENLSNEKDLRAEETVVPYRNDLQYISTVPKKSPQRTRNNIRFTR